MKKFIAVLSSFAILISVMVTANATKYMYGRSTESVVLNFYVDSNKTSVKEFKNLTLKLNWNVGNNPKGESGLVSVTSRIGEAIIDTVYNNEESKDSGVTTFAFNSEKGVELGGNTPFLSISIHCSTTNYKPTVDFYTEGQFMGVDSVDYAKKDIITTELSIPEATTTPENPNELNVENIGETETSSSTFATETVQPTTETVEPTTSATEQEPTEPKEAVKKPTIKQKNPIKVTVKTKTVKAKKLKKGKVSVKAITIKKAKGEVKYSKVSGSKKLTVNKTTGKIKIKKGTQKGNYTIKVRVTAKGNNKYKSKTIIKKVKIKVK